MAYKTNNNKMRKHKILSLSTNNKTGGGDNVKPVEEEPQILCCDCKYARPVSRKNVIADQSCRAGDLICHNPASPLYSQRVTDGIHIFGYYACFAYTPPDF